MAKTIPLKTDGRVRRTDLKRIKPSPRNPRSISEPKLDALVRSLAAAPDMLKARPLVALPDGTLVAGHQRLAAATRLGWKDAPVLVVDLTPQQANAWMVRDNQQFGGWDETGLLGLLQELQDSDLDIDTVGVSATELDDLLDSVRRDSAAIEPMPSMSDTLPRNEGYEARQHDLEALKLGLRLEAVLRCERRMWALELMAGQGQLSFWYRRLFADLVRVDQAPEAKADHTMPAERYIHDSLSGEGNWPDLIDVDDEGCPWRELDALFEVAAGAGHRFVLCLTDGYVYAARVRAHADLTKHYRWPSEMKRAGPQVADACLGGFGETIGETRLTRRAER